MLPVTVRGFFWAGWGRIQPYQKIIYRNKVLAWGKDRTAAYRLLFPDPPKGKTILDIGCHTGFYCFQAASEGAESCMGIDVDRKRIANGRFLAAKEAILNIEFIVADIRGYEIEKAFDIVICLNLLQHMEDIETVDRLLDKLNRSATDRLMLIVPLTQKPGFTYEYQIRGNIPYVLLSKQYFSLKYGGSARVMALPVECYGPGRALVIIDRLKSFSV